MRAILYHMLDGISSLTYNFNPSRLARTSVMKRTAFVIARHSKYITRKHINLDLIPTGSLCSADYVFRNAQVSTWILTVPKFQLTLLAALFCLVRTILQWRHNGCDGVSNHAVSRLFTQPFIQALIKEIIKAPCHWPLCGKFTGDRPVNSPHKWPVTRKMFPFDDVSIVEYFVLIF